MTLGGEETRPRRWERLESARDFLESPATKLALSVLILLSVLPFRFVEEVLTYPLLAVFGAEFGVRFLLLRRARREGRRGTTVESIGLLLDLVALLTFLPIPAAALGIETRTLRLLRLFRLVLLFRYSASGARTLWEIVARRERLRQVGLIAMLFSLLTLLGAVALHHLVDADEALAAGGQPHTFLDTLWWAFRQLQSPDNLVQTLRTDPLLVAVSMGLTISGLFLVAFVIGVGQSVMEQLFHAESTRPVVTRGHTVILGPVEGAELLVRQVVLLFHKNRAAEARDRTGLGRLLARLLAFLKGRHRVALLGRQPDPPAYLYERGLGGVVYRTGDPTQPEGLALVNVANAERVIVLSDRSARGDADASVVSAVMASRRASPLARVYAEVHHEESAAVLRSVAGDHTHPFEASRFLGLFLAQHLTVPGIDRLYRETFDVEGSEFYSHIAMDPAEIRALGALRAEPARGAGAGEGAMAAFRGWLLDAHREQRVLLTGLFLGDSQVGEEPSADLLVPWMNPLVPRPERPPVRGFVGLCPTYASLRRWVRRLLAGDVPAPPSQAPRTTPDLPIALDDGHLRRILVVGDNAALPAFLRETSRRRQGLEAVVATEYGPSVGHFAQRIGRLPRHSESQSVAGAAVVLHGENETRTVILGVEELRMRPLMAAPALEGPPFDAVMFLSDTGAPDKDARTSFRLLRFLRRIEDGSFHLGPDLHILAEIGTTATAKALEAHLEGLRHRLRAERRVTLRYTILSTERIQNYFLAHGAVIHGLIPLYEEILAEEGPELLRLVPADGAWTGAPVRFEDLLASLTARHLVPLAVQLAGEAKLLVNPPGSRSFDPARIRAIYALGEGAVLATGS